MRRRKALESTAYHEAGHAVMAWIEHLPINEISIVPNADSYGRILHANPLRGIQLDIDSSNRARIRAERAIRVALAGPIAHRHYNPRGVRRHHTQADYNEATDLILRITGSQEEAETYLKLLEIQTRQALTGHNWRQVSDLAKVLLEHQQLSRKEIRDEIVKSNIQAARSGGVIRFQ